MTRTVLITGAGGGICAEVARQLAADGQRLLLLDVDASGLDAIASELSDHLAAGPLLVDGTDPTAVQRALTALPPTARPEVLVNGIGGDTRRVPVEQLTEADLDALLKANLFGTFTMTRLCVPEMKSRGWGRIVNLASIAGRTFTHFSNAGYVAAKAAVIGYTKQCAYELAPFGIAVNAVAHGPIATPRIVRAWHERAPAEGERISAAIPVGRFGTVSEAAGVIVYLCGEAASYTIGTVIDVNGGLHI